jgi:hypothetical protein
VLARAARTTFFCRFSCCLRASPHAVARAGRWEEAIGTCIVFEEEAPAAGAAAGTARGVRHAGHTETRLVMRRLPQHAPPLQLPPPEALPQLPAAGAA